MRWEGRNIGARHRSGTARMRKVIGALRRGDALSPTATRPGEKRYQVYDNRTQTRPQIPLARRVNLADTQGARKTRAERPANVQPRVPNDLYRRMNAIARSPGRGRTERTQRRNRVPAGGAGSSKERSVQRAICNLCRVASARTPSPSQGSGNGLARPGRKMRAAKPGLAGSRCRPLLKETNRVRWGS